MGTQALYALLDNNPAFSFQPIDDVCDPAVLARQHKLVSVTQAFAIDLTGQVCADQHQGAFYGGLAAQLEFLQGASRSPGGKAIICLASTDDDGHSSRIRPQLLAGEGVAIARSDVHYVVTECGVAYLFGKSIRERAIALIQIAHPDRRAGLLEAAQRLGYVPADQRLRNLRAYAVQDERSLTLKNEARVLLRPATAADGAGVRELFHHLPVRDVYTRFFRKLKGLSNSDVQRLVNLDDELEVALVAVTGPREQAVVVAHAMYVIDPSTNLAETAFIVHPDWQGVGLGSALQRRLAEHAQGRGVRGFVADILATNDNMIRLAMAGAGQLRRDDLGGTVRITSLF
jgi:GNAT superfamily N-acetyltransferase